MATSVDEVLARLEGERKELSESIDNSKKDVDGGVYGSLYLQADVDGIASVYARNVWAQSGRNEAERLHNEILDLREETYELTNAATETNKEAKAYARACRDECSDCDAELSELRQEIDLLRRQQRQWQSTRTRLIKLMRELQHERMEGANAEAVAASRLGELQRMLCGSPTKAPCRLSLGDSPPQCEPCRRANEPISKTEACSSAWQDGVVVAASSAPPIHGLRDENAVLREQINRLEEENLDLIQGQQGLISYVQARMPQLEYALNREQK
eukprot:TRINITY_DN42416_c0_g1_i1.p1 TRINITY_DN42416_c0_g1~~TRINITY_DN42416_c0_g1_i1.p1  ORF type:complete len:315 (+),score=40.79 TRINITY_DN42416_c0_g1_i1:131-946(+)